MWRREFGAAGRLGKYYESGSTYSLMTAVRHGYGCSLLISSLNYFLGFEADRVHSSSLAVQTLMKGMSTGWNSDN
jgi:hypothetical protein